jgi:hypothetical protein
MPFLKDERRHRVRAVGVRNRIRIRLDGIGGASAFRRESPPTATEEANARGRSCSRTRTAAMAGSDVQTQAIISINLMSFRRNAARRAIGSPRAKSTRNDVFRPLARPSDVASRESPSSCACSSRSDRPRSKRRPASDDSIRSGATSRRPKTARSESPEANRLSKRSPSEEPHRRDCDRGRPSLTSSGLPRKTVRPTRPERVRKRRRDGESTRSVSSDDGRSTRTI